MRFLRARAGRFGRVGAMTFATGFAVLLPVNAGPGLPTMAEGPAPLVGFSFLPNAANHLGLRPVYALDQLLRQLHPDLVRLPVIWTAVEPGPGSFDFTSVDTLMAEITSYNRTARRPARVILTVGIRNLGYPEAHLPLWAYADSTASLVRLEKSPAYGEYVETAVRHYAASPLLYAWQVENEGLDDVGSGVTFPVGLPYSTLAAEVAEVRANDPRHLVTVTTFNSAHIDLDRQDQGPLAWLWRALPGPHASGHPAQALKLGDALGLDVYVATPFTPLDEVPAPLRIKWKADTMNYWADAAGAAGKQLWITEMQAYPWNGYPGFTKSDLHLSALSYADRGVSVVLLWAVESWLLDPSWMRSGRDAMTLLREG